MAFLVEEEQFILRTMWYQTGILFSILLVLILDLVRRLLSKYK